MNIPFVIFLFITILAAVLILAYTIQCDFQSIKASKQLIIAIENNDLNMARDVITQHPKSVNTLPSSSPRWWQVLAEKPNVYYPLQESCYRGRYDIVKLLIENGADCNLVWKGISSSKSPLMCAVLSESERNRDIIELLLMNGANITQKDDEDKTAYDYAVIIDNLELAELLKPQ